MKVNIPLSHSVTASSPNSQKETLIFHCRKQDWKIIKFRGFSVSVISKLGSRPEVTGLVTVQSTTSLWYLVDPFGQSNTCQVLCYLEGQKKRLYGSCSTN